jgi:hypothetical protein
MDLMIMKNTRVVFKPLIFNLQYGYGIRQGRRMP